MQSLLAASLEWFDRQPGEVQETVAFLVGTLVMDMAADRDETVARFRAWLSPPDDKLTGVGNRASFLYAGRIHVANMDDAGRASCSATETALFKGERARKIPHEAGLM